MSLKFKILDENNTTTNLDVESFRFYAGEDRILRVQIYTDYTNDSREILAGGSISLNIPASPTHLTEVGVIDGVDRSIITVALDETDTASMISGDLVGTITEGTDTRIVKSTNIMVRL